MHDARVLRFAAIMAACYAVWFAVYDLWLLPDGRLDAWLSTEVAAWTGGLLTALGQDVRVDGREVWMGGAGIQLIAECNGLSVLSLFVGFVLAYPGRWSRRAWFIPLGIVVIQAVNVLRCAVLLALLGRSQAAFDVGHGSGGLLVFYAVVFALWVVWSRIGGAAPSDGLAQRDPATALAA